MGAKVKTVQWELDTTIKCSFILKTCIFFFFFLQFGTLEISTF